MNLCHTIIQTIKNIILPFFFVYIVNSNHTVRFYGAIALGVLFIWLVAASIIKWRRFTYRIEDDEFRIEEGLFVTKKRYISIDRIQTMNTSAGLVQQIFKLVKLQIETAGGGKEAEAVLSAISVEEAERIKEAVFKKKAQRREELDEERLEAEEELDPSVEVQEHYRMNAKELLIRFYLRMESESLSPLYLHLFPSLMKCCRWIGYSINFPSFSTPVLVFTRYSFLSVYLSPGFSASRA